MEDKKVITEAQKKASKKYLEKNREKINEQRKKYYADRKDKDPSFLEYKRQKAKEYYDRKKALKEANKQPKEEIKEAVEEIKENIVEEVKDVVEDIKEDIVEISKGVVRKKIKKVSKELPNLKMEDLKALELSIEPLKEEPKFEEKKEEIKKEVKDKLKNKLSKVKKI